MVEMNPEPIRPILTLWLTSSTPSPVFIVEKLVGVRVVRDLQILGSFALPLDDVIAKVHQAASLINDGKYYEASQIVKQVQDSVRSDVVNIVEAPDRLETGLLRRALAKKRCAARSNRRGASCAAYRVSPGFWVRRE